jgi:hypothetical protein
MDDASHTRDSGTIEDATAVRAKKKARSRANSDDEVRNFDLIFGDVGDRRALHCCYQSFYILFHKTAVY